jgi:ribonuclease H2 subunit B
MLLVQDRAAESATPASSPTSKANGRAQHALLRVPHPRHGERALFMLAGDDVLELRRARRPEYACWFVGDRCESQGDIMMATRMDPLFLALPALEKARKKTQEHMGRFCSGEQIFAEWAETCDAAASLAKVFPLAACATGPCLPVSEHITSASPSQWGAHAKRAYLCRCPP